MRKVVDERIGDAVTEIVGGAIRAARQRQDSQRVDVRPRSLPGARRLAGTARPEDRREHRENDHERRGHRCLRATPCTWYLDLPGTSRKRAECEREIAGRLETRVDMF